MAAVLEKILAVCIRCGVDNYFDAIEKSSSNSFRSVVFLTNKEDTIVYFTLQTESMKNCLIQDLET